MSKQIYTEECKAGKKWCPHVAVGRDSARSFSYGCWTYKCVGSHCMAWRWADTHIKDGNGELVTSGDTHGFCGLSGVPQ